MLHTAEKWSRKEHIQTLQSFTWHLVTTWPSGTEWNRTNWMCTVLLMDRQLRKCLGERISVCECDSMKKVARRRRRKVVCVWGVCVGSSLLPGQAEWWCPRNPPPSPLASRHFQQHRGIYGQNLPASRDPMTVDINFSFSVEWMFVSVRLQFQASFASPRTGNILSRLTETVT